MEVNIAPRAAILIMGGAWRDPGGTLEGMSCWPSHQSTKHVLRRDAFESRQPQRRCFSLDSVHSRRGGGGGRGEEGGQWHTESKENPN